MTEKGPNTSTLLRLQKMRSWCFTSLKSCKTSIFKDLFKIFSPMVINVQFISLTHEQLHFLCWSVRGVLYDLLNVLGPFQSLCNH